MPSPNSINLFTSLNSINLFTSFFIFMEFVCVYLSIRYYWVLRKRHDHIDINIDEFTQIDKKYSYDKMLFKYFYIWNYNWFIKQTINTEVKQHDY